MPNNEIMIELIELNSKLKNSFDKIYYKWVQLKYDNGTSINDINSLVKLNKFYFMAPDGRMFIMTTTIKELKDNGIDIEEDYNNYFDIENKIITKTKEIQKQIDVYEKSIESIKQNNSTEKDINNYIACVKSAYLNYKKRITSTTFKFYSSEMNNTFYQNMPIDLSIEEEKLNHLLGLPSENDKKNVLSLLYQEFKKEIKNVTFIDFIINYSSYYIDCILYDSPDNLLSEETKNKINSLCRGEKGINDTISKSFEKCLNFKKIYEYKFIPEIIFDYDTPQKLKIEKFTKGDQPHSYDNSSGAFTPLDKNKSKSLGTFLLQFSYLSDEDKLIIQNIKEYFPKNYNILIEYNENKPLSKTQNGMIKIFDEKNDIQYKYNVNNHKIKSDLPVNVFLISYNDTESRYELLQSKAFLLKSILITLSIIKRRLNITSKEDNGLELTLNKIKYNENLINEILKIGKDLWNEDTYKKLYDLEKIINSELSSYNLFDSKRDKLINIDFIKKVIESKPIFSDEELNEYEKHLDEYMDSENYKKLELIIKSLVSEDFNSKHFYEFFNLFVAEKNITDTQPQLQMFMPFTEYLREEKLKESGIYFKYDKTASLIGFSVRRELPKDNNIGDIVERYPKTFMGKSMLQVLTDLRMNGRSFKLDAIYEDTGDNMIYYSITPLTTYGPFLKLKQDLDKEFGYSKDDIDPTTRKK